MPTLVPGKIAVPRWRRRMVPAFTDWPAPVFMPSRWPTLSRPFRELPAPFLCAMSYSWVVFDAAAFRVFAVARGLARRPGNEGRPDHRPAVATQHQDGIEAHGLTDVGGDPIDHDSVALRHPKLFSAGGNDGKHGYSAPGR